MRRKDEITILVVEDNKKLANYIKAHLTELDYKVSTEGLGDKAAYRILREQPDLVILDIMLPRMDGRQVCQTVRNEYRGKILMLTALNEIQDEVAGLTIGADDYLSKPAKPELLTARIDALLRRQYHITPKRELYFGALRINLIKNEAWLLGKKVDLKPSEFELLALLAKNADYALNRDNIMEALRGIPYDGIDRIIDLRISYLRKKLNDNIDSPYRIKTIHGKGYVFIANAWKH